MRVTAGSAAAPAARCKNARRGSFMALSPWKKLRLRALLRLRIGRSLLLELQLLDHPLLMRDLLHRERMVLFTAEIETLLVELGHGGEVRRLIEALLEGVVQNLHDPRVHALWPADAIGRV